MLKYIELKENASKNNFLKIELYYKKGGMNYFTGRAEGRGYYLSVCPVQKSGICESYTGFTGTRYFLKEVSRKSEKAYQEALNDSINILEKLIDYVCKNNNLEVKQFDFEPQDCPNAIAICTDFCDRCKNFYKCFELNGEGKK